MPDINSNSSNTSGANPKKARLGRGLGSLLGGAPGLNNESPILPTQSGTQVSAGAADARPSSSAREAAQPVQPVERAPANNISDDRQIWMIPVDRLAPNKQQPRQTFEAEPLRDLTASIREKGILMPIVARRLGEREFEIIAGERRWRAAQAAGLHEVPVILKDVSEQDSLELAIIENIQRENLNPMEEAEAFELLINEYHLTQQQVADKLGKERPTIANSLRLLLLPSELKEMVRRSDLSTGHAKVLLAIEGPQIQLALAKQVIQEKLSVRATEKLVAKQKAETRAMSGSPALNVDVSKRLMDGLSAELQKLIGTKVVIDYADSKGKINIHFYSDEQLTQIVEKLRAAWEK